MMGTKMFAHRQKHINQDMRSTTLSHLKKLQIMGQEFGQIDIYYGSQHQGVFIFFWKSELWENKPSPKEKGGEKTRGKY